jgi:hypothetical protein
MTYSNMQKRNLVKQWEYNTSIEGYFGEGTEKSARPLKLTLLMRVQCLIPIPPASQWNKQDKMYNAAFYHEQCTFINTTVCL